tara:strand:+ start:3687 stop:4664 length:978 start_codon:yes stop_codon:yes gene_type:complete
VAYTKEPRKITKHQFASTTTVDGSRIDACMDDVEQRVNALEHGDIDTAWTQTVFHAGWQPKGRTFPYTADDKEDMYEFKHHYPWLAVKNPTSTPEGQLTFDSSNSLTTAPTSVQNLYRFKGYENKSGGAVIPDSYDLALLTPYISASTNRWEWRRGWSTSFYFTKPAIITQVSMIVRADGADSILGTNRPYQHVNDLDKNHGTLLLDVADPNSTEDKQLDSQEYLRTEYPFDGLSFNYHGAEVFDSGFTDMMPSVKSGQTMPYGRMDGIASIDEVNIPVPANSRVRLSVIIPGSMQYNETNGVQTTHMSFWNPMSLTMHALERVE